MVRECGEQDLTRGLTHRVQNQGGRPMVQSCGGPGLRRHFSVIRNKAWNAEVHKPNRAPDFVLIDSEILASMVFVYVHYRSHSTF